MRNRHRPLKVGRSDLGKIARLLIRAIFAFRRPCRTGATSEAVFGMREAAFTGCTRPAGANLADPVINHSLGGIRPPWSPGA